MTGPQAGDKAPGFKASTDGGGSVDLAKLKGRNVPEIITGRFYSMACYSSRLFS